MNEADNGAEHKSEGNQPDPAEVDAKTEAGDEKEAEVLEGVDVGDSDCLLYTSPSPRDATLSRMPSSA